MGLKQDLFLELSNRIRLCTICSTIEDKGKAVPFEGDIESPILIVGRNPGKIERDMGRPFYGPGGRRLNEFLEAAGLNREEIMIANVVCCYTDQDRPPVEEEITHCSPYLRTLIGIQKPQWIVVLGKLALQAIVFTQDSPVKSHGSVYETSIKTPSGDVFSKVFSCWHPGSSLRSGTIRREFMADAVKLKEHLNQSGVLVV